MDWTKIPTTLITKRFSDYEISSIVKLQLVWALNEEQPDKKTALRYMTEKQYETAMTYLDSVSARVSDDVSSVIKKRSAEKIRYNKNKDLSKNLQADCTQSGSQTARADKIRLDKNKEIHKENNQYGEGGMVLLTEDQHSSLVKKYQNIDKAIEELDTWLSKKSDNAKKYIGKNHYAFFKSNSWIWRNVGGCLVKKEEWDKSSEEYHQYLLSKKRPQDVVDFVDGIWDVIPF